MTPRELLERTKDSIIAAPDFYMGQWSRCIACHVCRAAGYTVEGEIVQGEVIVRATYSRELVPDNHVVLVANKLLPESDSNLYMFWIDPRDKQEACHKIDRFIATNYPEPAPDLVVEEKEELVCV